MGKDNSIAVITDSGLRVTYRELKNKIKAAGRYFEKERRSVAVIVCQNTIGCLVCYLTCLHRRIVPLLVPETITSQSLIHLCEKYEADYLCAPKENMIVSGKRVITKIEDYFLYKEEHLSKSEINEKLALLLMTSGSTGNQKCVRISRANLISNTRAICEALAIQADDRAITSLPINYTYGLSVIQTHLYKGATILLTNKRIMDKAFWDFFDAEGGTTFAGVPFSYECIYKMRIWENYFKNVKVLTQAGGKLSEEMQKFFGKLAEEKGYHFYIMYGQTEATARMSYLPYENVRKKIGSAGIAIPGGSFTIQDEEIVYTGKNVCMGYAYERSNLKKGDVNGGKLHTGDRGYLKDGYLYVTGRIGREVKLNGFRINLDDIENVLQKTLECQVACIECGGYLIIYRTKEGVNDYIKNLQQYIPIPRKMVADVFVNELPYMENGKLDYEKLKKIGERKRR